MIDLICHFDEKLFVLAKQFSQVVEGAAVNTKFFLELPYNVNTAQFEIFVCFFGGGYTI